MGQMKEDKYLLPSAKKSAELNEVTEGVRAEIDIWLRAVIIVPLVALFAHLAYTFQESLITFWFLHILPNVVEVGLIASILSWSFHVYFLKRDRPVYLVDFSTMKPDDKYKVSHEHFNSLQERSGFFSEESRAFMARILAQSAISDDAYYPKGINLCSPPELTMANAREEAMYVFTSVLDDLFAKTGVTPKDIDLLVVNCSLFCPTPSLSAMIINKYKMRNNVRNYNLGGMGCSAGVVSIDLAKDLLQVHPNSLALVVSTENITQNWYRGKEKGMLLANTLFRMGGAAVLLSNKSKDRSKAKYKLLHTVRVHRGADDESHGAIVQEEDSERIIGVRLSKRLIEIAGEAIRINLTVLGPLVLPLTEQAKWLYYNILMRKLLKKKVPVYIPDFKKAFDHFCIHAGGRGVLDGLQKNLMLSDSNVAPSRDVLFRYGNTSSSSIWYELEQIETKYRIRKGHKVWQLAFGSGFKCNSAVWLRLKR